MGLEKHPPREGRTQKFTYTSDKLNLDAESRQYGKSRLRKEINELSSMLPEHRIHVCALTETYVDEGWGIRRDANKYGVAVYIQGQEEKQCLESSSDFSLLCVINMLRSRSSVVG